jgi:hypothetical protein
MSGGSVALVHEATAIDVSCPPRFAYQRTRAEAGMPSSVIRLSIAPDFRLSPLIGQSPGPKSPAITVL